MEKQVTVVQQQQQSAVIPFNDIERMALAFAKSGLFGIKTPEQGIALMLIAQAEGMHPAAAARDYHIIQGRPALRADSMLARFQQAGGKVIWNVYSDDRVSGTFSHPSGGSATIEWTLTQAKAAGLTSKDVWRQYPRAMLRARVISEGIRTVYPGVAVGVYTVEEVQDFDAKPATQEVVSEPVVVQPKSETAEEPNPGFDRKGAFKKLASSGWSKEDLAHYAWSQWGKESAKDLTDTQLTEFLSVVSKPYSEVIASDGDSLL
jgi:hypothetical protein